MCLGYQGQDLRLSYVLWQEGVRPVVAIELLSPGTQDEDLGRKEPQGKQPGKWKVYEQVLGVPYYITFNRYNNDELQAFGLAGSRYQAMELLAGRLWMPDLEIGLALWRGEYRGALRQWLRWYDALGNWVPTEAEREQQLKELAQQQVEQAQQQVEQAQQQVERERQLRELAEQQKELAEQRAQELAQRLRELGLEP